MGKLPSRQQYKKVTCQLTIVQNQEALKEKGSMLLNLQMGPVVGGIYAELTSALIIIMGIFSENCGVNKRSVAANLLRLFLMLVSAELDLAVLPLLIVYMMFGIAFFLKKWRKLFFIFSSKTYTA